MDSICLWLKERQLKLAPHKCSVLEIKRSSVISNSPTFYLDNTEITSSSTVKDLGIFLSSDLKWAQHIDHVYKTASLTSYRILKSFKTTNIWTLLNLYTTYVRPKLEFNSCIWSPYLNKDIERIERIQKSFTRKACLRCNIPFSSYQNRLYLLGIQSLQYRRLTFDLIQIFKIINGLSDIKFDNYFIFKQNVHNLRGNTIKIQLRSSFKNSKISQIHHCFFNRVIKYWNLLPDVIATTPTLNAFKRNLSNFDLTTFLWPVDLVICVCFLYFPTYRVLRI